MSDLMLEEFDAWFLANAPKLSEKASWLDPDAMAIRRLARHAWQASRECLVVDLPEDFPFSKEPKYQSSRQQTISECRAAIHAAGVKYK